MASLIPGKPGMAEMCLHGDVVRCESCHLKSVGFARKFLRVLAKALKGMPCCAGS